MACGLSVAAKQTAIARPRAENPVEARSAVPGGRGAGKHGRDRGLPTQHVHVPAPRPGPGPGWCRGTARPAQSCQPFQLSTARSARAFCAGVLAFHLSELVEALPFPYPRPGLPGEPDESLPLVDLPGLELFPKSPTISSYWTILVS